MRVVGIEYAGKRDVYNMEVAETHDFAVSKSGIIVHNCYDALRYFLMSRPSPSELTKKTAPGEYDPFRKY